MGPLRSKTCVCRVRPAFDTSQIEHMAPAMRRRDRPRCFIPTVIHGMTIFHGTTEARSFLFVGDLGFDSLFSDFAAVAPSYSQSNGKNAMRWQRTVFVGTMPT